MEDKNKLTEWVINKIQKEYKDDIALLIGVHGHSTGDDLHGVCFDFFVPANERGNELAETFIIDGVGHDLYPRTWDRLENSVQLDDMAMLLDKAEILYSKSEEDTERFMELRKRLFDNLNNNEFVYGKALEYMDKALEIYRSLIFEEKTYRVRAEIGCILLYLSQAVAVLNHTYAENPIYTEKQAFNEDEDSRIYHCPLMKEVPEGFFELAGKLLRENYIDSQMEIILKLIKSTRKFILDKAPGSEESYEKEIDYNGLREWYQELSLTWRRIRYFCERGMVEEAYVDALYLQEELLYISQEYKVEEMNLLDAYNADNLSLLRECSDNLEKKILNILNDKNVGLKSYESVDEFLSKNN